LGDEPAKAVVGDLRGQVALLLHDYNFIFIEDGKGNIREVWVFDHPPAQPSGRQPILPYGDRPYVVKTTRRGAHHYIEAVLTGPNSHPQSSSFLIDTGATTVVLPASMIETLGFHSDNLKDGWTQAVSGRVPVKRGLLASVKVGDAVAENVEVSFIADEYLGSQRILGMNFLRNFRVFSIDDKSSELILFSQ
jgi:aspartyl protease family protein